MSLAMPESAPIVLEMYWQRTFPGRPEEARQARSFLRALLPTHPGLDDMLQVVDELVVNAIRHTRSGEAGGTFRVRVLTDAACIAVSVIDEGGPGRPVRRAPGGLAESGRGLALVAALSVRWFWSGSGRSRAITACFAAPSHPESSAGS
ncbi:ATP-binding protein [Spirillospora sp. NPDC048911]|uniref:ATP-binding protein n=1 Tax=Spirillospora sp. NPDC048911 TaxID=3364527 RepID=UPI003717AC1C